MAKAAYVKEPKSVFVGFRMDKITHAWVMKSCRNKRASISDVIRELISNAYKARHKS